MRPTYLCKHDTLRRKCDICDLEEQLDEQIALKMAYRSMLAVHFTKRTPIPREEWEKLMGFKANVMGDDTYFLWNTDWAAIDAEANHRVHLEIAKQLKEKTDD